MYILTVKGKEEEGAYAPNVGANNVLYLLLIMKMLKDILNYSRQKIILT